MNSYEYASGQELGEYSEFGEYEELGEAATGEYGEMGEYEYGEAVGQSEEQEEVLLGEILGALPQEATGGLGEALENELAAELLEITNEQELEQFLGKVFGKVVRGVGKFVKSPVGRALGGVLKGVAKKALPIVGGALGSFVAPGIGTAIGSKLGSMASGLFELPAETMPQEQAEFEVARRYVRLAAGAARHAAAARPTMPTNPYTLARAALARTARVHAPGLYHSIMPALRARPYSQATRYPMPHRPRLGTYPRPVPYPVPGYGAAGPSAYVPAPSTGPEPPYAQPDSAGFLPASGRWVRRGRRIIVLGV